jgi:hypothetical protein
MAAISAAPAAWTFFRSPDSAPNRGCRRLRRGVEICDLPSWPPYCSAHRHELLDLARKAMCPRDSLSCLKGGRVSCGMLSLPLSSYQLRPHHLYHSAIPTKASAWPEVRSVETDMELVTNCKHCTLVPLHGMLCFRAACRGNIVNMADIEEGRPTPTHGALRRICALETLPRAPCWLRCLLIAI